jgi:hypothetical protein
MNYLYDIHSWSKDYREERLTEARTRHLERQLRTARSVPPENHKKGGEEVNDAVLRIRIAAPVVAVFLSVAGATLAASALAGEDRAASFQVAHGLSVPVPNTGNSLSSG